MGLESGAVILLHRETNGYEIVARRVCEYGEEC